MMHKAPTQQKALQKAQAVAASLSRLFEDAGEPVLAMRAAGLGARAEEARVQARVAVLTHSANPTMTKDKSNVDE
jgi:hypothetical protein